MNRSVAKFLAPLTFVTALGVAACSSGSGGSSDVSWKDITSKKLDATKACQDLFGAHSDDAAKKVGASALATAPNRVTITGELDGDSDDSSLALQCNLGSSATRFFPSTEATDLVDDGSVTATSGGFEAEAHTGDKGPGMQGVLSAAVRHLKP